MLKIELFARNSECDKKAHFQPVLTIVMHAEGLQFAGYIEREGMSSRPFGSFFPPE